MKYVVRIGILLSIIGFTILLVTLINSSRKVIKITFSLKAKEECIEYYYFPKRDIRIFFEVIPSTVKVDLLIMSSKQYLEYREKGIVNYVYFISGKSSGSVVFTPVSRDVYFIIFRNLSENGGLVRLTIVEEGVEKELFMNSLILLIIGLIFTLVMKYCEYKGFL